MRTKRLSLLAASVPAKKLKKADTAGQAAHIAEQQEAFERGKRITEILQKMASKARRRNFRKPSVNWNRRKNRPPNCPAGSASILLAAKAAIPGNSW